MNTFSKIMSSIKITIKHISNKFLQYIKLIRFSGPLNNYCQVIFIVINRQIIQTNMYNTRIEYYKDANVLL